MTSTCKALFLFIVLILSACSTLHSIDPRNVDSVANEVEPGETVEIETLDGQRLKLEVLSVDEKSIRGKQQMVAVDNIKRIHKQDTNVVHTVGLAWGIGALIAIAFALAL